MLKGPVLASLSLRIPYTVVYASHMQRHCSVDMIALILDVPLHICRREWYVTHNNWFSDINTTFRLGFQGTHK